MSTENKIKTSILAPEQNIPDKLKFDSFTDNKILPGKRINKLPAMGWNSWNAFGSGNTWALTKVMADRIKELELDKLGYVYVVLDDGCYCGQRKDGHLLPDTEKFPEDFGQIGEYIHSKGLKFGMYNDIGVKLCSGLEVGTCGHEDVDAADYRRWDIDYLKVDNCYYLWDDATFSDPENARFTYAPNIKEITVIGENFEQTFNAVRDGILVGDGVSYKDDYVTNIGTFDGTGPARTPVGDESGELRFEVTVPKEGSYSLKILYATGRKPGVGEWLQVSVGTFSVRKTEDENGVGECRYFDALLPATEDEESFTMSENIEIKLKEGTNIVRIMNHRRQENVLNAYAAMMSELASNFTDKEVLLSICEWGKTNPQNWGYKVGNSWRILNDITFNVGADGDPGMAKWEGDYTDSITSQYNKAVIMDEFAGLTKGWNDPDMLVIGMSGMDDIQNRTHMSMWCMLNSPLMLGMDLRNVQKNDPVYNVIANEKVIALNQDSLGIQAKRIYCDLAPENPDKTYVTNNNRMDVCLKPLGDGSFALAFFNLSAKEKKSATVDINLINEYLGKIKTENKHVCGNIKETDSFTCENLWTGEIFTVKGGRFEAEDILPMDCLVLKVKAES